MMWASFERHLLIFYDRQIYNNNLKRFSFHYIPIRERIEPTFSGSSLVRFDFIFEKLVRVRFD
jgi:hypothetical protein